MSVPKVQMEQEGDAHTSWGPVHSPGNGLSELFPVEEHRGLHGRDRVLGC